MKILNVMPIFYHHWVFGTYGVSWKFHSTHHTFKSTYFLQLPPLYNFIFVYQLYYDIRGSLSLERCSLYFWRIIFFVIACKKCFEGNRCAILMLEQVWWRVIFEFSYTIFWRLAIIAKVLVLGVSNPQIVFIVIMSQIRNFLF